MTRVVLASTDICSIAHEHASHSRICVTLERLSRKLLSLTTVIQTVSAKHPSSELETITGDLGLELENAKHITNGLGIYPQVYRALSAVRIRAQFLQVCRSIGLSLEALNMVLVNLDSPEDFPSGYFDDLMELSTSFQHLEYPLRQVDVRVCQKTKNWASQVDSKALTQGEALNLIRSYLEETVGKVKLRENWGRVSTFFLHDIHLARSRGDVQEENYLRMMFWAINGVHSPPPEFLCPISLQLLQEPVILFETEVTYEKRNIVAWMAEDDSKTCPISQKQIKEVNFVENRALKAIIHDWSKQNSEKDKQYSSVYERGTSVDDSDINLHELDQQSEVDRIKSSYVDDSWDEQSSYSLSVDQSQIFPSTPSTGIQSSQHKTPLSQTIVRRRTSFGSGSSDSNPQTSRIQLQLMSREVSGEVFRAASNGDLSILEDVCREKSWDFSHEDESGRNPLHVACIYGKTSIVEFLINKGLSPRCPTKDDSSSPLILASSHGHHSCVEILLKKGADLVAQDKRGWTALHAACDQGRFEVVKRLVRFGLHHNLRFLDIKTETGWTILHSAARCGDLEIFSYLISLRCNINEECKAGWTPLHVAVEMGHRSIVDIILQNRDTKVNIRSKDGWTALHTAVDQNDLDIGRLLLQAGIDVNTTSNEGITSLHRAAYSNKLAFGKMLIEEGNADLGIKTKNGRKASHIAAENGNNEFYNYLHWKSLRGLIQRKKKTSK